MPRQCITVPWLFPLGSGIFTGISAASGSSCHRVHVRMARHLVWYVVSDPVGPAVVLPVRGGAAAGVFHPAPGSMPEGTPFAPVGFAVADAKDSRYVLPPPSTRFARIRVLVPNNGIELTADNARISPARWVSHQGTLPMAASAAVHPEVLGCREASLRAYRSVL